MSRPRKPYELKPLPAPIHELVQAGELVDVRTRIPVHDSYGNLYGKRFVPCYNDPRDLFDIFGLCLHHTGTDTDDPVATARYHTSPGEHITRDSRGLPTVAYPIMVTKKEQPPLLIGDIGDVTWAQGNGDETHFPGDENRHLLAVVFTGIEPTASQQKRIWRLVEVLQEKLGLHDGGLFGHADFGKQSCPGKTIYGSLAARRVTWWAGFGLNTAEEWRQLLLPQASSDEVEGAEWTYADRRALTAWQRKVGMRPTGTRDPFSALRLLQQQGKK